MYNAAAAPDPGLAERSRLFLRHQQMLMEYVRCLLRGAPETDDLFQEVGVLVLSNRQAPLGPTFPAWCRGVARNLVLHHWRSKRRAKEVPSSRLIDILDLAYNEADAEADAWNARRGALRACLQAIDDRGRDLLLRRYREGETSEAAGARLGRSAVAVRKALMTIKRTLLGCIQRRLAQEGG
jgi:RNA polymerase sigma-70 factor (ECF subfamily)